MPPKGLHNELVRIGRKLNRWQGEIRAVLWISILCVSLWLFALSDLFLRYERVGRVCTWTILIMLFFAGLWQITVALRKKRSVQGVAARIEHVFPALDNQLINYIQFSAHTGSTPMETAYIQRGVPEWQRVRVKDLRDRKKHSRTYLILSLACLILVVTRALTGAAWTNSLLRVLSPFSTRPPATLAAIEKVIPGDSAVLKGEPVILVCHASGNKGQAVYLNLWPADDKKSTIKLGHLSGTGTEEFPFEISKAATDFKYRFRAGDAVSRRYDIRVLPPLAFTELEVTVRPPKYTGLEILKFDGLTDRVPVPQGSIITLALQCNRKLSAATLITANTQPVSMKNSVWHFGSGWAGEAAVTARNPIAVSAVDTYGHKAETSLKHELLPDKAPVIRVLAPLSRTGLRPGIAPQIQWEVSDDYGLSRIRLEKVPWDEENNEEILSRSVVIREWPVAGIKEFATNWTGEGLTFNMEEPLALQIVAVDNNTVGKPNRARSSMILFEWSTANDIRKKSEETAKHAVVGLNKLVELQRINLEKTIKLRAAPANIVKSQWQEVSGNQRVIRKTAGQLIANPRKPLGPLTESAMKLYQGAMMEVIDVLDRVPFSKAEKKTALSKRAVLLENRILRVLTRVNTGIDKVKQNQYVAELLDMLDALVKGQKNTLKITTACLKNPSGIGKALAQKQERLADDVDEFAQLCKKDAETQSGSNPEFSQLLTHVAKGCERKRVSVNMLRAAENLEKKAPSKAITFQKDALAALKEFQNLMNEFRVEKAGEKAEELRDALKKAGRKLDKLIIVESKVADAIREANRQEDKSLKDTDDLEEEMDEQHAKMKEAILQIAVDLQIFPELPVGNDLVEDVFQVFEEIEQAEGSENIAAKELGLQKEDWIMDGMAAMKDTKERLDMVEQWLPDKPDSKKANIEAFDQEEIPGIPVIPMPSEMEDIIGDLLEIQEEIAEESDDSASNQSVADCKRLGWNTSEGEFAMYAAKGKSGSDRPDHKEQDGRSNIGRQGMSDGETAAGSGKIGEGDDNMEKRMTQDPSQSGHVTEEEHSVATATGGGKTSGYGDELGMAGSGPRRDSKITEGSELGRQAMLKRNAEALYARAQISHLRTGSLDEAIHYMQLAEDAMANEYPIQQVREFQRLAVTALKKTKTELGAEVMPEEIDLEHAAPPIDDQLAGARDEAPHTYRALVSEYFKSLSAMP